MQFTKTIVYVADIGASLAFFESAFGLKTRFVKENIYGELETGATTLAFASPEAGRNHLPDGYVAGRGPASQVVFEVALTVDDVEKAFRHAVGAGAQALQKPAAKPWGQTVATLLCPDGTIVDLSSPMPAR